MGLKNSDHQKKKNKIDEITQKRQIIVMKTEKVISLF